MSDLDYYYGNDNMSSTDYEVGYRVSLALAVIVGFFTAFLVGFDVLPTEKKHRVGNVSISDRAMDTGLFLLPGCGVSLLVWGCVKFAMLQQEIIADAKGVVPCMIFGAVMLVCIYPWFTCGVRDLRTNVLLTSTYFLLLPGLVVMAIAYKQLSISQGYDFMTMRITDTRATFADSIQCEGGGECVGYRGQIQVTWGSEWSCPENPNRWCSVWITEPSCDIDTGRYNSNGGVSQLVDDDSKAIDSVTACMQDFFKLSILPTTDAGVSLKEQIDQSLAPQNDIWPTLDAFGTCSSSCEATIEVPDGMAERMLSIGFPLCIAGVTIVIFCIATAVAHWAFSRKQHQEGQAEQGADSQSALDKQRRMGDADEELAAADLTEEESTSE